MDPASKLARLRTELASLEELIGRIQSGEEAARLRRLLVDIEDNPAENELDVSGRLAELEYPGLRSALLAVLDDQARSLERRIARLADSRARTSWRQLTTEQVTGPVAGHRTDTRSSGAPLSQATTTTRPPYTRRPGLWDGLVASGGALAVAVVFWFAVQVVLFAVDEEADVYFERHGWIELPFTASIVCAFIAALAFGTTRTGGLPVWTLVVVGAVIAVPAFGPDPIFWPALGVAVLLVAALATIGGRRPRPRPRLTAGIPPGLAASAVCLALVPAVAVGFYGQSTADDRGRRGPQFCDTHACIPSFEEGTGSIVQCADGMWSRSGGRPGACSHHGGVAEQPSGSSDGIAVTAPAASQSPRKRRWSRVMRAGATRDTVTPTVPDTAALEVSATQFLRNYYLDLEVQDFHGAWRRLGADVRATFGGYEAWQAGFEHTISQRATDIDAIVTGSSASVALTLHATDIDACADSVRQRFAQTWTLTRIDGRWQATGVTARKVSGQTPAQSIGECEAEDIPLPRPSYPDYDTDDDCPYLRCTEDFENGRGSVVRCADGTWSSSGGIQGACSHHGGVDNGYSAPSYDGSASERTPSFGGGRVHVDGYYRSDGTYVRPHTRRAPCPYC
jgi:hypothetical protein